MQDANGKSARATVTGASAPWQRLLVAVIAAAVFWSQLPAVAVTGVDPPSGRSDSCRSRP